MAGRVLPFYILLCNNCICDLGQGWHRNMKQVLEDSQSLEKPISRAQSWCFQLFIMSTSSIPAIIISLTASFTEPRPSAQIILILFSCQIFTITDKRLYCQKINASVNDSINIDPHWVYSAQISLVMRNETLSVGWAEESAPCYPPIV